MLKVEPACANELINMCCQSTTVVPTLPYETVMTHTGNGVYKGSFTIVGLETQQNISVSAWVRAPGGLKGEYTHGTLDLGNPDFC